MNLRPVTESFPALNGEPVTEAHVRRCAERGHATYALDGVPSGLCPRCGEPRTTLASLTRDQFLEMAQGALAVSDAMRVYRMQDDPRYGAVQSLWDEIKAEVIRRGMRDDLYI